MPTIERENYKPEPAHFYRYGDPIKVADHLELLARRVEKGNLEIPTEHHKLFETTLLQHEFPEAGRKAAVLLGFIGTPALVKVLETAKRIERDDLVKKAIEAAIGRLKKKR